MSSPSTRPPNPGDDAVSSLWLGVRFLVIAPLLPARSDAGGVAAVFRGPGVQATTMPEGNDREHDGHHRQGHGFGGDDAPARRAHVEIVLTPGRGRYALADACMPGAAAGATLSLPRIRSERPAFELHHPYMIDRMRSEAHPARGWKPLAEAEASAHLRIPETEGSGPGTAPFGG